MKKLHVSLHDNLFISIKNFVGKSKFSIDLSERNWLNQPLLSTRLLLIFSRFIMYFVIPRTLIRTTSVVESSTLLSKNSIIPPILLIGEGILDWYATEMIHVDDLF